MSIIISILFTYTENVNSHDGLFLVAVFFYYLNLDKKRTACFHKQTVPSEGMYYE